MSKLINSNIIVVLVNYNGWEDTIKCIESISKNETANCEIIVVDNSEVPNKQLNSVNEENNNVHLIYQQNKGFGAANNLGIEYANENFEYDYLLLLNNDTEIGRQAITKMFESFKISDKIGIVTCKTLYPGDKEIVWYGGGTVNYNRGWAELIDYKQPPTEQGANKSKFVNFAPGCVMLFNRKSIDSLQGFDDRLFMYVEDLELCIRAEKKGIKIWYDSEAVVYHKVHGSFTSENNFFGMHPKSKNVAFYFYQQKLNQWITFRKHLRGVRFIKFFFRYWAEFIYTYLKLIILSKQRWVIFKSGLKIVFNALTNKYSS